MKTIVGALALVATAVAVGCTLLVPIPDSLTTPPDVDAAPGSPTDGGAISDATLVDGESGSSACTGGSAVFCDDFDHGAPFARWDRVIEGTGFGAVVDPAMSSSPPGSLLAHIDQSVSDDCAYARPEKTVAGSFSRMRLSFSFRAEGPESLADETVATMDITSNDGSCSILASLQWTGANYQLRFFEQITKNGQPATTQIDDTSVRLQKQTWEHLDVNVDYVARTLRLLDAAGNETLSIPLQLACPYAPAPATVTIGFHCSPAKTITRQMRADDVVFDPR